MRSKLTIKQWFMCVALACAAASVSAQEPRRPQFRADDPVAVDDDRVVDASRAQRDALGAYADFVLNSFFTPGDRRPLPAVNVNSLGEVPDSSWFTNRIGTGSLTLDDIVRGPDRTPSLNVKRWMIVQGKDTGRQAGFRAVDADNPDGAKYQIEFDPAGNPEMATGAEIIGTAVYHALGYNVVDVYLIDLDPAALTIAPTATIEVAGRTRPFTRQDLAQVLRRAARKTDGHYRALASRFAEGTYMGPFRYYGMRADDPNDIYPHEHRRELRGNRVFTAWLNHDDSRAINTLDMLVGAEGRRYIKHYMFDFGSILGSGTNEEDLPWVGHEYVVQSKPALLTFASLGLWRRPFIGVNAPADLPAAGNFTADRFEPASWRPHYRNAAFENMQPEDAFWAARLVAAFSPEAIARIVNKARFTDPRVTDHITGTLLRRRELILRTWLTTLNPLVQPEVADGTLRCSNAAVDADLADPANAYELSWFRFDNATGARSYIGRAQRVTTPAVAIPAVELAGAEYVGVDVRTLHEDEPLWRRPVRFYLRAVNNEWRVIGIDRGVQGASPRAAAAE
ncbi:MAG TPA: hypothetical protein VJ691_00955 [Vicinamibacterales bacterium]|nr:hypothetical protein [Vicinamibacterales bacterium]